ncbi:flagella basal body P-ring formation protein FlgA [Parerythrobacter jejuensis]|uniref:Flagella basal body P-ring formation protein FlgA SAF domain-containing protein n=1 Tax=Parerythrobacter jejuensis TaxID=795812 RepID=A0A845AV22_9SPHN|nr:flagella basal body P-ring formation protein FlgA [Parerythrobacter jejuensis]MXP30589.1 hypothetical protein [Parerythrobacter jejuensis]MXP33349.1 hypothetical protein [Parerythrobacter jejuensis]
MRHPVLLAAIVIAAPAAAQAPSYQDAAQIDRLVEGFTGNAIGTSGGARAPVDRRLRLQTCSGPLALDWYGAPGRTVQVACPGAGGWRIYVNLVREAVAQTSQPVVARGEMITIAVRGRGFSVQQKGEAEEGGAVGDWIKVRTSRKAGSVRARIERPGLVVIPSD